VEVGVFRGVSSIPVITRFARPRQPVYSHLLIKYQTGPEEGNATVCKRMSWTPLRLLSDRFLVKASGGRDKSDRAFSGSSKKKPPPSHEKE
jgi:hypothetical protein